LNRAQVSVDPQLQLVAATERLFRGPDILRDLAWLYYATTVVLSRELSAQAPLAREYDGAHIVRP
jgi:hypothetical protein